MSTDVDQQRSEGARLQGPVVGLLPTHDMDSDAVAGASLRAQRHGYDVLAVAEYSITTEAREFVKQLNIDLIETDRTAHDDDPRDFRRTLYPPIEGRRRRIQAGPAISSAEFTDVITSGDGRFRSTTVGDSGLLPEGWCQ